MRQSVVSFLGSTVTGSSVESVEVDGQVLVRKVQELHNFVEQSFRQQGKLLRELRRAQRRPRLKEAESFDSWNADSEPDSSPEPAFALLMSPESTVLRSPESTLLRSPEPTLLLSPEPALTRESDSAMLEGDVDVSAEAVTHDTNQAEDSRANPGNEGTKMRLSFESPVESPVRSEAEGSKEAEPRGSQMSQVSQASQSRRFALRISQDSARTSKSSGQQSASRSWTTDASSPDSLVQDQFRKHFTAAQVQATWQQRRRAASAGSSENEETRWRQFAQAILRSTSFWSLLTLLIFLHVLLMGVEVEIGTSIDEPLPEWLGIANLVLVSIFVAELGLKFAAFGCWTFWCGNDRAWNAFDFVVIALSVFDVILEYSLRTSDASVSTGQVRVFRVLRIFRYVRSIRVVRLFRYISALQVLTLSILGTMSSLAWTLALLVLIIYSFGVLLTEIVTQHCRQLPSCPSELTKHWESVGQSMLSLFMAISQGLNWEDLLRSLLDVSPVAAFLLIVYVIMTIFAILNVVTGVFCNTAIESAGADKDVRTLKQIQDKNQQVQLLKSVFDEIDFEQVNEISFEDVKRCLATGELSSFVESMGISTDDVWTLFMLLDSDQSGLLDIDDFVNGCLQLRGPAKSLQVAKMSFENKLTRTAIREVAKELAEMKGRLDHIRHKLKQKDPQVGEMFSVAL